MLIRLDFLNINGKKYKLDKYKKSWYMWNILRLRKYIVIRKLIYAWIISLNCIQRSESFYFCFFIDIIDKKHKFSPERIISRFIRHSCLSSFPGVRECRVGFQVLLSLYFHVLCRFQHLIDFLVDDLFLHSSIIFSFRFVSNIKT